MSPEDVIRKYREALAAYGEPETTLVGLPEETIVAIERDWGHELPAVYREFLRVLGGAGGQSRPFAVVSVEDLRMNVRDAKEKLAEWGDIMRLPDGALIFYVGPCGDFAYFLAGAGPDPTPYWSGHTGDDVSEMAPSLTALFSEQADCLLRVSRRRSSR